MLVTDIRNKSGVTGYNMPPQMIPTREKDDEWVKLCLDTLENIGVRYLGDFYDRYFDVERIVKGGFKYKDFTKSSMFLSELDFIRSQADLASNMTHYPFIEPIINQLVIDYIKKPNPFIISAEDDMSVNDYIETQTKLIWERVQNSVNERIYKKAKLEGIDIDRDEFETEEEQIQHQEMVDAYFNENTPEQIKQYMGTSYKPIYIDWAEKTIKESELRYHFEEKFKDLLYHYFLFGRCFLHHKVGYDFIEPEVWHPRNTFTSVVSNKKFVELGDYVGNIDYYTPNDIIVRWGSKLTAKQKEDITGSAYYKKQGVAGSNRRNGNTGGSLRSWVEQGGGQLQMLPHKDYYPYENARFIQEELGIDLGVTDWFGEPTSSASFLQNEEHLRNDLIRVMEVYWVGYQKIGYLSLLDEETGQIVTDIVTDEILKDYLKEKGVKTLKNVTIEQHYLNPEPNTIVWDYVEEVRHGIKISRENTDLAEDLYIDGQPIEYQLMGESNIYQTRLPVTGLVTDTSLASRITPYQIDYNIALNMAKDYASKELGVFFLMDMSYLPQYMKEMGAEEKLSEIYEVVRELGLLPIDGSTPEAGRSKFNQFSQVNMDLTDAILGKINYATAIKRQALEVLGFAPERMGMPSEQKTATGIDLANSASFSQTEMWYHDFSFFQNNTFETHLNICQYVKSNDKDNTVFFADQDLHQHFLKINDPYLPMRRLKIYAQNNGNRKSALESLKQWFMSDNTIPKDLEVISEVLFSDSVTRIKNLARLKRKEAQLLVQQEQQARQHEIELQKSADIEKAELEHRHKMEQITRKGEIDLNRQAILALGFEDEKDINKNNVSDIVEQLDLSLKSLKQTADIALREQQNNIQQSQMQSKANIDEKKLLLEEKKLEIEKYKADRAFDIARENKYSHEVKKNKEKANK